VIDLFASDRLFLRVDECCRIFAVAPRTLYNWLQSGFLPSIKIGHCRRIPISEVRRIATTPKPKRRKYVRSKAALRKLSAASHPPPRPRQFPHSPPDSASTAPPLPSHSARR
jgi:excisionase family DNA binding protein